jgi:hypothetical protein
MTIQEQHFMRTGTTELQPNVQVLEEAAIVLTSLGTLIDAQVPCSNATETDMALAARGNKSHSGLTAAETATLHNYCGPCPFQESCLADAIMTGNLSGAIVGGLNQKDRKELHKYYDSQTQSIPQNIWGLAIEAVLEERAPDFPGSNRPLVQAKDRNGSQGVILDFLSQCPNSEYTFKQDGDFFREFAEAVELHPLTVRRSLYKLLKEGTITKAKDGKYVTAVRMVA